MDDYASRQRKPTKHLMGLGLVVVLHLFLFWAISSGLARSVIKKVSAPVQAVLLEEQKPDIPPPPPPPPPKPLPTPQNLPPPPPAYVPPVVVAVEAPAPVNTIAAVSSTPQPPAPVVPTVTAPAAVATPAPVAAPVAAPVRVAAVVNSANCETPDYPSASRRLEEEGTVSLRFLVGVDGKVLQSEVVKSSGFKRLDEAARAGLSRCAFKPATVNGKPEQAWASMNYTWRLE